MWVWPAAGQVCARRVSQWRNVSGAFRRRFPMRVSCGRLRASILHRHGPLLPTEVLCHVPGPQTEVPLVHLVNVSSLEVEISVWDLTNVTFCFRFFAVFSLCSVLPSFLFASASRHPAALRHWSITTALWFSVLFLLRSLSPLRFNLFISSPSLRSILLFMASLRAASTSLSSERCGFSSLFSFIHQFTGSSNISFACSPSTFPSYLTNL